GFVVYKYDGESGEVLWSARIGSFYKDGFWNQTTALDPDGNVLISAGLQSPIDGLYDFVVAKLDGHTRAELWRSGMHGVRAPEDTRDGEQVSIGMSVAADAAGDVFAVGAVVEPAPLSPGEDPPPIAPTFWHGLVLKLAGSSGAELWRADEVLPRT